MSCMRGREGGTDFKLEIQDGRHLRRRVEEGGTRERERRGGRRGKEEYKQQE
jgi:hypothetical protein